MQFRLIGLFGVEDENGPVRVAPGRESALLALLLVHRGDALANDRLVEELWGDTPPENAAKGVQVYISRLRRALGVDRIETTPAGYRIRLEPGELDIERFEELADARRTSDALALWRGEPLTDFRYAQFAQTEARRLEALHSGLLADRVDELLAQGDAPIAELEAIISRDPLWERPRGQFMRALYLAGRQVDALEVYRQTRDLLNEELGVEPGPELQRLERAILNQDPELGRPPPPPRAMRRRRAARRLAVGGLVLAGAAVAAAVIATRGSSPSLKALAAGTVGAIDPRTGKIVAQIATGDRPARIADVAGRLWVLNAGDRTVSEIDAAHQRLVATFGPNVVPTDIAATASAVWIGATRSGGAVPDRVARFDATRHQLLVTTALRAAANPLGGRPPDERYLVAGGGHVFAIGPTLEPTEVFPQRRTFHVFATSLAYGDGALWAVAGHTVVQVNPRTGRTEQIAVPSLFDLGGIAVGGGYVWATSPEEGVVWRIDPRPPHQTTTIQLAYGASTIAYGDSGVWVGNSYDDSITRIDPRTRMTHRVATIPAPQDIAVDADHVWVASGSARGRSGALVSAACSSQTPQDLHGRLLIVSDFALRGGEARTTNAAVATIENMLAARHYRAGRFRLAYQSCDDSTAAAGSYDDGQCVANASSYAADVTVVGVVGTSDSPCALDEIPILNRAPHGPLAIVSPFDTGPFLTRRGSPGAAQTLAQVYAAGPRNFTRSIGGDHVLVAAAAVFARRIGLRRIAVLYDRSGMLQQAQARWFAYAAGKVGVTAVPVFVDAHRRTLRAKLRAARVGGAFLVSYVLGPSPATGRPVISALSALLPGKPVIVTDAFPWPAASEGSNRYYALFAGASTASAMSPRDRRLLAALPRNERIPWAVAQTAAATRALLDAIAASDGTRRSIVELMRRRSRIDRWGDPVTAPVTVLRLPSPAGPSSFPFFAGEDYVATITPLEAAIPPG